jgi:hypothetical protein
MVIILMVDSFPFNDRYPVWAIMGWVRENGCAGRRRLSPTVATAYINLEKTGQATAPPLRARGFRHGEPEAAIVSPRPCGGSIRGNPTADAALRFS